MDSDSSNVKNCTRNRCVTCHAGILNCDQNFGSYLTGQAYSVLDEVSCETDWCVYLIRCKKDNCQMQYVGHTINSVAKRMSSHKSHIRHDTGCKILSAHFTQVHSIEDMSITPIQLLDKSLSLKEREAVEEEWMKRLNTLYPYGLNVRAKTCGVMDAVVAVESSSTVIYSKFEKVNMTRYGRGGNRTRTDDDNFDSDLFINSLVEGDVNLRNIRTRITQLNYKKIKSVYLSAIKFLGSGIRDCLRIQFLRVIKDISLFRCKCVWARAKPPKNSNFLVVNYENKFVEDLSINKILCNVNTMKLCPLSRSAAMPTVSYKYPKTIRSSIVNYRQTHEANLDPQSIQCMCETSSFKDPFHNHVVTGNLDIIQNSELRSLLKKGLNYRDQAPPDKHKAYQAVKTALENYIKKKSNKNTLPESMFQGWKSTILTEVKTKLDNFSPFEFNCVLGKEEVLHELEQLQEQYVFVPTDKADKNVSLVCKKFYVQLLHDEISSDTYQLTTESEETIVNRHKEFLKAHGIKMKPENEKLPYLYGTVKMHKNPVKFRFITAGRNSSLKQLSVAVGLCLQGCLKVAKNHSNYVNRFYSRNDFYVIDSNKDVLNFMFENNLMHCRKSVSSFDFSTLFTSIPHQQLKDNLTKFVNRIFEIKDKTYIVCNEFFKNSYFSDNVNLSKGNLKFNKDEFLECIYFLIDNSYVKFNNSVYRQVIGIPMGTSAAPHVANIYLHVYEFEYFTQLYEDNRKDDLAKLEHIFRYQDDLLAINDDGLLESVLSDIYPPEMIVNKTNISVRKTNFLDLTISIYRGKFYIKLYDKRNDYDFEVINYPFLDGNIPKNQSYSVFISQLVRFARVNSSFNGFIGDCKNLVSKLSRQHFNPAALRKRFDVFSEKYFDIWGKFGEYLTADQVF